MTVPGMPPTITALKELTDQLADQSLDVLEKALIELEIQKLTLKKEMNRRAGLKRAEQAGLKPIDSYRGIKSMINEKVIYTVKKERLRHIDVADFSMIHRPRVTRIMNRHLERVSIDCMFKILGALGVSIEIKFS